MHYTSCFSMRSSVGPFLLSLLLSVDCFSFQTRIKCSTVCLGKHPRQFAASITKLQSSFVDEKAVSTSTESSTIAGASEVSRHKSPLVQFADVFSTSLRTAYQGDTQQLRKLVDSSIPWGNPFVSTSSELWEGLTQFSNFFEEPSMTVFKTTQLTENKFEVEYQLSFWYPMAWRPRIIIPVRATVTTNKDLTAITSVAEKWEVSVADIFLKQLLPRFWDVWHLFCNPTAEYPPIRELGKIGKVSLVELPQTVCMEVRWSGLAKYPGPPLLVAPGFSLFGNLRTSRPKRDIYYTVLPLEVQSGRYRDIITGEEMKRSSWIFHVPTSLQHTVFEKAQEGVSYPIDDDEAATIPEGADDAEPVTDYKMEMQSTNVMKSVTGGVLRGQNAVVNEAALAEFLSKEKKEYIYKIQPRRIVAQVDVRGEAKPEKIAAALKEIRAAVEAEGKKILGRDCRLRSRNFDDPVLNTSDVNGGGKEGDRKASPDDVLLGLQLWNIKACFNQKAEPAMAIYEIQYNSRLTKVHVEVEFC